eukprot:s3651_g3.t1
MTALIRDQRVEALQIDAAKRWRQSFAFAISNTDRAFEIIHQLPVGGTRLETADFAKLSALLVNHGVWPERVQERTEQILAQITVQQIRNVLASTKPWPDLKAAANAVRPQLKLIQTDELNAQIAKRTNQRKFGRKDPNFRRHDNKERVTAQASELMVPHGVFRQQDGTVLGPLQVGDVGLNAKGVLLLDQADSNATLRLQTPVSQHGLAVIVLATPANAEDHKIMPTRFPAMCVSTQEPLIASGYLYQLGKQEVVRHEPSVKLAIDEHPTEAIRCLIFKDQAGDFWDKIQQHPVKHVFQSEPILAVQQGEASVVIDVWDRQWVTKRYEKTRPANAEVFMFSFRMMAEQSETLLTKSGQNGIYWEPRTACGRYPNGNYHVTWLSNMTYQDAKYAQQTSPQATTLARHGERYGLRSDTMNAQEIHEKHRPDTPLLMGQSKMLYAVGPLPFSTTKAALHKLLKAWTWDARPLQPKGRAQDGSGVTWHVQAIEDPGHWVYSLQHGDVLVTKLQDMKSTPAAMPYSIVASKKTLEHLQGTDPWLSNDPWTKGYQPPVVGQATKAMPAKHANQPVTQAQLAAVESMIDQKMQMVTKSTDGDANMEPGQIDHRITQLEQQFQHMQALQMNTDTKINQMQHQIDHQSKQLGDRIDEKLSEQMDRIEQLLCKRSRLE